MTREYIAVQAQLSGNGGDVPFYLTANSDRKRFSTAKAAIKHGLNHYDHDDFWIATVEGDRLVDLRWQEEPRDYEEEEWAPVRKALELRK